MAGAAARSSSLEEEEEEMMRLVRVSAALLGLACLVPAPGQGQTAAEDPLRKEIEALREGQKASQKDIEEIKRPPRPCPASPSASRRSPRRETRTRGWR